MSVKTDLHGIRFVELLELGPWDKTSSSGYRVISFIESFTSINLVYNMEEIALLEREFGRRRRAVSAAGADDLLGRDERRGGLGDRRERRRDLRGVCAVLVQALPDRLHRTRAGGG